MQKIYYHLQKSFQNKNANSICKNKVYLYILTIIKLKLWDNIITKALKYDKDKSDKKCARFAH